ncbi:MAG TPA: hypothetical protein VK589_21265 [Chryseolinea sp.]|nr:hypothetical protein [Chryseolinea sp.]
MSEEKSTAVVLRSADRINDSTFERIWKFYYDPKNSITLKPKEEEIRQRLINIWGHLADILTDRKAVLAHIKWCEENGYSVKESIAYEDLKHAKMLFGDRNKQSKAAQRAISSEILLNAIREAVKKRKHMSAARLIKEYNELNDLKNHSNTDAKDWKPATIIFDADPETLKKQMNELRKKAQAANAIDITPEE